MTAGKSAKAMCMRSVRRGRLRRQSILVVTAITPVVCLLYCSYEVARGENEVFNGIATSIKGLNPENEQQLEDLARIVRERSFKDIRRLVEIMDGEDGDANTQKGQS